MIQSIDWSKTALGPTENWPISLRTTVGIVLENRFPMCLWWGQELISLYNDAYCPILGDKHPHAMGEPGAKVWEEIWPIVGPLAESILDGGPAVWNEHLLLPMQRKGFLEETYFTFSYSPVPGDKGLGGVLITCQETTEEVQRRREMKLLRDIATHSSVTRTPQAAGELACRTLSSNPADIPFALLYLVEEDGAAARLVATAGLDNYDGPMKPSRIDLLAPRQAAPWPLSKVMARGQPVKVDGLREHALPSGDWSIAPDAALCLPLAHAGQPPHGYLIAGMSARRELESRYEAFFGLVADQLTTTLGTAQYLEKERQRAEELEELDRAKTTFFHNISHEFRTPLTLLMSPIEELRKNPDRGADPYRLELVDIAYRNGQRLLRLVNDLLDFSRIEAGRTQACFQPVDLAEFTAGLASQLQSACTGVGIQLKVDCAPLPEPVWVDKEMWEKIVINLLSNAFKYTQEGEIRVRLETTTHAVALRVADTGIGIAANEIPHIFDRFHRTKDQRGRTFEGTGIGLSLVQELVRLHGGEVGVTSEERKGSTFTVTVPRGRAHLPAEQCMEAEQHSSLLHTTDVLLTNPERLCQDGADDTAEPLSPLTEPAADGGIPALEHARILVAEDNADMRKYMCRLLERRYHVETVADGEAALAAIRRKRPDLVLTDVMMPRLDGYRLLRTIREDASLHDLPVIVLSAQAGEEASAEGLSAGADDYIVKPFSAKELTARVNNALAMAQLREKTTQTLRDSEARFRNMADHAPVMIWLTDESGDCTFLSRSWYRFTGQDPADSLGFNWLTYVHPDDKIRSRERFIEANAKQESFRFDYRLRRHDGEYRCVIDAATPRFAADGTFEGYVGSVMDITDRREAEEKLRELNETLEERVKEEVEERRHAEEQLVQVQKIESLGQLTGGVAHDFNNILAATITSLELVLRRNKDERLTVLLENALKAARRGAKLVDQLLTFARKQRLAPQPSDLNKLILSFAELLQRALGPTIELKLELDESLWPVMTDIGQFENAVLNLAMNARDALTEGGKLTIATGNAISDTPPLPADLEPGDYVRLRISDTGTGMSPEVVAKAFDPFYTTKEVGKGTGLGLSQVHGFAKQLGGTASIASRPGEGTTVWLFLPRSEQPAVQPAEETFFSAPVKPRREGDKPRVLVVDDDAEVRASMVAMLYELGLSPEAVGSPNDALAKLARKEPPSLALIDFAMPEMNGQELIRRAHDLHPKLPCLLVTGYADDTGSRHDWTSAPTLRKPFTVDRLAAAVEELLKHG
ncbi:ATP-binding protein [Alkalilimnicola ehrlichii]|uniref:ATP-binding protein n=1 Tax=Alkalilimnicola ehrlichii TaxID=351052 RepID=UPI0015F2492A|nr:ATP-binding protein [Alkalilimnicola ehrlichii]